MLSSTFLGFFLHSVNLWIWKLKKTPEKISIYSIMVASVLNLISGNVTALLQSKGFVILYFFTLLGNMTLVKTIKDNSQIINRSLKCL
jgi:cytochrome c oxidase assembly factor CtaG